MLEQTTDLANLACITQFPRQNLNVCYFCNPGLHTLQRSNYWSDNGKLDCDLLSYQVGTYTRPCKMTTTMSPCHLCSYFEGIIQLFCFDGENLFVTLVLIVQVRYVGQKGVIAWIITFCILFLPCFIFCIFIYFSGTNLTWFKYIIGLFTLLIV